MIDTPTKAQHEALIARVTTIEQNPAPQGQSAYEVAVAGGFTGTPAQWLASLEGADGRSAYQSAVAGGFSGTEAQWVASLEGPDGKSAYQSAVALGFSGTEAAWVASLKGAGFVDRGPWAPGTVFALGDYTSYQGAFYSTLTPHTATATFDATKFVNRLQPPDPYIVPASAGLDHSGVANDRFCCLLPGSKVLKEAQPWTYDLKDAVFYYKDSLGNLWRRGAPSITVPGATFTPGARGVLIDKTSLTAPNYAAYLASAIPANLQLAVMRPYKELFIATSATTFEFSDASTQIVDGSSVAAITDNLSSYAVAQTGVLTATFDVPYRALVDPLLVGSDTNYPGGVFGKMKCGTSGSERYAVTRTNTAGTLDGEVLEIIENDTGTIGYLGWMARVSGAQGSETNIRMQLDTSGLTFVTTLNGSANTVKNATGGNLTNTSVKLVQGTLYWGRFRFEGTKLRGKVWVVGTPEPDAWMLEGLQNSVMTAGKVGVGANAGYIKFGMFSFVANADPAPTPAVGA